ncbi:Aldehyde dehydrogenase NAD(P)-dependent family and Aldehyde dehydrogenase domain and Aldehyde/histidinol dehydrogenase domain and Aldehyde dehydrogenase, N-terminal domain and Aldehyde dehydrogenase, C-terminal domain-containing protein [Strongyloides ratti]|uniref:Aldehyde dehydrogenase n=1 Tax=Strongyloides ratti TaxID=34506 RepID=A0A090MZM0_STRRB|nr:Aldehyde dehydrogenase NAD(P)-dependent family and Aldehyde dehydrogenase domain and Aldehyde/histidinol dehydrogenase domain and Aldehyde dehydrogenase, N-terminal domain and Aldehyde dehydrogenase, C-terminal domain-containing protein [Strongyloides ratti]CEF69169.1 Aldehyde dehydrogenase NAD(P)-dependent family and Aldehyde dehydrogenase domain and Aldehyde/histidinol dehydrogenase domain and Aldehyde dehydrogenase, N-terminal domain and Aldehyde dehydrogenase, C-terminal domain-containing p
MCCKPINYSYHTFLQSELKMNFKEIVDKLRENFNDGCIESYEKRKEQLLQLRKLLVDNEKEFIEALWKDLHKSEQETLLYETQFIVEEIDQTISELKKWMASKKVSKNILQIIDGAYTKSEALGVVLIIGAWNFPVQLLLGPMIGAIAAGNAVVLKPSELAVHTSSLISKLIPSYLSPDIVSVVTGGPEETTSLLNNRFDHIFFTGSYSVGKIIYKAAAEHLTPITLELGGKCPVIIDDGVDINIVARRLAWGKLTNCGQICVAADYVLMVNKNKEQFIKVFKDSIKEFYGENIQESPDYCRIINERHFDRIIKLLNDTKGNVIIGGDSDKNNLYISPTVVDNVKEDDSLMSEELFAPILPIMDVESIDKAIEFIKKKSKPLSLYLFSNNQVNINKVLNKTSSGNVLINDLLLNMCCEHLPFGGVGNSGFGRYHGKYTFDTFSHEKAVLHRTTWFENVLFMRYPPYGDYKINWAKRISKKIKVPF